MKTNEKNAYTSPKIELVHTDGSDVISTSGFNGGDHVFGKNNSDESAYET
ncbi:MAG: hypothetical protein IKB38_10100 [Clostridia bacterium]|nr:hypothetical protein [Clostridia bacterium]